jgi:hypothetical protein
MNAPRILVTIAAAGLCTSTALAQRHQGAALPPPGGAQAAGIRPSFPAPTRSLGGARMGFSQSKIGLGQPRMGFPQPSRTLGGVKAVLPTTPRGTFGNPAPDWRAAYKPMPIGPMPSYPANTGWNGGGNWNGGHGRPGGPGGHSHGGGGAWNGSPWNGSGWSGSGHVNGSGVTINGAYTDDNFKLAFHVGNPFSRQHDWCGDFNGYPTYCYPPAYYSFPAWGSWYYPSYYDATAYSSYAGYTPAYAPPAYQPPPSYQATPQPVTPSTERELGDTYLRAGDAKAAIKSYRAHLYANPTDAGAMRALALALIETSEFRDGAAMMSMAYTMDAALARSPVPLDAYAGGAAEMRENLTRVSLYANRVKTPSAWLSLAVLMQAEGRNALARTAIDKAQAAGLDRAVADHFRGAL